MAYLDDLLARNEQVKRKAHRHVLFVVLHTVPYLLGTILLWALAVLAYQLVPSVGGIVALLLLAASILPLIVAVYRFFLWRSEEYIVTNYRIIQVEGIFNKRTFDSALDMVNDVEMTQSMFGRLFNFGSIHVISGSEVGVNYLTGIDQPSAFKRALLESKVTYGQEQRRGPEIEAQHQPGHPSAYMGGYGGYHPAMHGYPMYAERHQDQQSESVRLVMALTELRNAGLLSDTEYEAKMRQATGSSAATAETAEAETESSETESAAAPASER